MKVDKHFAPDDGNGEDEKIVINSSEINYGDTSEIDKEIEDLINQPESKPDTEQPEPSDPPVEDKEITEDNPEDLDKELDTEIDDKKTDEPAKDESTPPDDPPAKDKEPDKADFVITEEYIKGLGLTPELATKLNKFIGKPVQELAKSLAHAQTLIGKKKEDLLKADDVSQPAKVDIPAQQIKQAQTPEEIAQAKDDLIHNELLKDFPDLPKDPVERKKYLSELNYEEPERFYEYRDKKVAIQKDVDEVWRQTVYLRENHDKIIDQQVKETATELEGYIKNTLKLDPKVLGYDFTLDAEGNNEVIGQLLSDPKNPQEFDARVLTNYNGVTLINKDALIQKFIQTQSPNIVERIKTSARKEGFTSATQKKVAPSMATAAAKGKENKELNVNKIDQINNVSEIDRLLDEMEK